MGRASMAWKRSVVRGRPAPSLALNPFKVDADQLSLCRPSVDTYRRDPGQRRH
jgi:hypothetical protein